MYKVKTYNDELNFSDLKEMVNYFNFTKEDFEDDLENEENEYSILYDLNQKLENGCDFQPVISEVKIINFDEVVKTYNF